jgi:hypothetical protein
MEITSQNETVWVVTSGKHWYAHGGAQMQNIGFLENGLTDCHL